jgi:hypothetical protein
LAPGPAGDLDCAGRHEHRHRIAVDPDQRIFRTSVGLHVSRCVDSQRIHHWPRRHR